MSYPEYGILYKMEEGDDWVFRYGMPAQYIHYKTDQSAMRSLKKQDWTNYSKSNPDATGYCKYFFRRIVNGVEPK